MLSLPPDQLSAALFQALARGEVSARSFSSALLAELAHHCPNCRAALEAFLANAPDSESREEGRVLSFRGDGGAAASSLENLEELEALLPEERLRRVRRSRKLYSSLAEARSFLGKAREALPSDAPGSRHWAELALVCLSKAKVASDLEFWESAALDARAWGFVANAERVAGNLQEAEQVLYRVFDLIRAVGVSDLSVLAELQSFAGSLRRAQRRWAESNNLLETAASLYSALGQREKQAQTLLKAAINFYLAGDPEGMLARLEPLWLMCNDTRTRWEIRHNQVLGLLECGEPQSAAVLLDQSLSLYKQFPDSWSQSRLAAINGRVLHALGIQDHAERNYRLARTGFLELGEPYAAAMISLDLAVLLLEDQRFSEVGELALDMLATFQKVGVHREALAAWQLFVDAAHRQEASVLLARRLGRFLEHARQDPSLQFAAD